MFVIAVFSHFVHGYGFNKGLHAGFTVEKGLIFWPFSSEIVDHPEEKNFVQGEQVICYFDEYRRLTGISGISQVLTSGFIAPNEKKKIGWVPKLTTEHIIYDGRNNINNEMPRHFSPTKKR